MNHRAYVAKLYLDLDRKLVETPIRLSCSDAVKQVWELHELKAFGLVSLGRFLAGFDTRENVSPTFVPLFVRSNWHGCWIRLPDLTDYINYPSEKRWLSLLEWRSDPRGLGYGPCNRGPQFEVHYKQAH